MRRLAFLLACMVLGGYCLAQVPNSFRYQAVIRDQNEEVLPDQQVSIRISLVAGAVDGTVQYTEVHQVQTNSMGLISLEVGNVNPVIGN
ncbi:MAG: hypothetical protein U0T82_01820 [Bacteroidales bacterium]